MIHNLIMSCFYHTNLSPFMHSLDPAHEESELEVQVEETNPEPEQGKPRWITQQSLTFILNHYLMLRLVVH
jgi:hypothetical protein